MTEQQYQTNEINKLSRMVNDSPNNETKVLLLSACLRYQEIWGWQALRENCKIFLSYSEQNFNKITIYKL